MKISILLPYKENFSPTYPGAVSIFLNAVIKKSKYRKFITVYGNTEYKKIFPIKYKNISISNKILGLGSQTSKYIRNFIRLENKRPSDIIEVHNRPFYIQLLPDGKAKKILYFHNDPLSMNGSKMISEREELLNKCSKIIFNSEWSKNRFLTKLSEIFIKSPKLIVIKQSADTQNININKKKKIITFVGKLNRAKGYDIFGSAIIDILNDNTDWSAIVIGDEEREKLEFNHERLNLLGFKNHDEVIKIFKKTSISVVCSRWEEPFGRTSLESASCGCAVIITNRGGLPETITNGIILKNLSKKNLYDEISNLIKNTKYRREIQRLSLRNFNLTHKNASIEIDNYRNEILLGSNSNKNSLMTKIKILHVTNFNERHNGRLFYNTGKRINNGFVRLNHSVLEFSDRDIVSYYRKLNDINGSKKLNKKFIEVISNYLPDLIVFGHADLIKRDTIKFIKSAYPNIKFCQWFLDRMDSKWINNLKRFEHKLDLMDANFCTSDPKILKINKTKPIYYIPNPVDDSFEKLKNDQNKYLNNDVFFAMSHGVHRGILKKGKFDEREILIEKLKKLTPNIKYDLYGMEKNQPIWADNFINKISKSKMGINLSQGKPIKYYSSDRFAQLIGNGLLVFIDKRTKFSNFLNSKEIVTYKNINDLAKKIIKFNKNDKMRKKVARRGREKYHKYFNSKIVAEYIINRSFGINYKKYYWE
ncbi:glycosyltransferase [Pelagibacterales bacterium SAG-MED28]|nr:glycosyltransferase [Pelagibacterales bacterium SAG-MED28]